MNEEEMIFEEVALRKESVDRNIMPTKTVTGCVQSLSARRAWIEIENNSSMLFNVESLSARRAWIEMPKIGLMLVRSLGRSPQGERG